MNAPAQPSVLRMAAPLVVSFWMRAAFSLVDTFYAATIGDAAVAAIGLAVPFEFLMIAAWVGLSTGLTANLSRAMGARQQEKIVQYLKISRRLVALLAPLFVALGIVVAVIAPRLGLDPEVGRAFRIYGTTTIAGGALTSFWSIIPDSLVKAHQDTRTTMWAGIWSNLINVFLNTVFLFVFHWGVFGIALSTVIGRLGGLIYAQVKARAHERRRLADTTDWKPGSDPAPFKAILGLAIPSSLTFALMAGETQLVNMLLSTSVGATAALAAYSIFHRVALFMFNPVIASSVALLPYASRRIGESDAAGLRRGFRQTLGFSAAYCILFAGPLMFFGAPTIAGWLAESPVTASYATFCLRLVPITCLVGAPFLLIRPIFEAGQRGRPGLLMALVRYVALTPPLAWAGIELAESHGYPGIYGLCWGLVLASALVSIAFYIWMQRALTGFERFGRVATS